MTKLTREAFSALRKGATVIEADPKGEKVLRLGDGSFLKLFRRKRILSSALLFPPARRFRNNVESLAARGIPCPQVTELYEFDSEGKTAVRYWPLPGDTVRGLLPGLPAAERDAMLLRLAAFIARLHDLGIYFRSLHFGNVILTPSGEFGLIDLSDMRAQRAPISRPKRIRNFRHFFRYKDDARFITELGTARFLAAYNDASRVRMEAAHLARMPNLNPAP
ncbi:toluene tolerance protein [Aromatoleum toluclasticum]|uniref:lipopolysaccharide kinase InaA family protein n=1 Tax=Aromatoleum toluclasticum TaxID=92003 RepID=UPI001D193ECD|nr:lipopolysaccharide kinase InaA family protein [Aromatoleum toluclasticum]MCC4117432.1 toluene tolerance protein [Aromatoleum toluclasticum]